MEYNDRNIVHDDYRYRTYSGNEQKLSSRSIDNEFYRENENNNRIRYDYGRRREELSRRSHDGSDEYSRRLDGNYWNEHDGRYEHSRSRDSYSSKFREK